MSTIIKLSIAALSIISLSACKSIPSYTPDYSQARQQIAGINLNDQQALEVGQRFVAAFNTLGTPQFVDTAGQLYAEQLFINDTLAQFSSKQDLIKHFNGMNQRVSNVSVKLLNTTYQQDSAYVHWHMTYDFKFLGRNKTMSSYGISEIKINPAKQIVFQQDYWDPANGLYRSLPYVSGVYAWLTPFKKVT